MARSRVEPMHGVKDSLGTACVFSVVSTTAETMVGAPLDSQTSDLPRMPHEVWWRNDVFVSMTSLLGCNHVMIQYTA